MSKLCALVLGKALIDRAVDLLTDMAGKTLPRPATGGGKLLDPLLFQALAQLRLAAALLPVALLALSQLAMKGPVVLAGRGGHEVGDAHIHAVHRGRWRGLYWDDLIITEGQPPAVPALVEGDAGVDGLAFERLAVIGRQLDGEPQLLAECERADREPVVKGRVLRGFEDDHIGVGLDAGLRERRDVPLAPHGFFGVC